MTTVFNETCDKLSRTPEFCAWRKGELSAADYACWLEEHGALAKHLGLNEDKFNLTLRYSTFEQSLSECISRRVRESLRLTPELVAEVKRIRSAFDHGDYSTYIFPEEEEVLASFVAAYQSTNVLVVGSYYGYWASMAAAVVFKNGGTITLVDPDPAAMTLAKLNFEKLFGRVNCTFACTDFFSWLDQADLTRFDTIIQDADGDAETTQYERRGKKIYGPVLDALFSRSKMSNARIIMHNMIISNRFQNRYFSHRIRRYLEDYRTLFYVLEKAGRRMYEVPTTEGIGVVI